VSLTAAVLNQAEVSLERWRRRVAAWGEHLSVPMPRGVAARGVAAVDDNLDVSSLVRTLIDLEDEGAVRPGVKFETFCTSTGSWPSTWHATLAQRGRLRRARGMIGEGDEARLNTARMADGFYRVLDLVDAGW
jgi:hypothetical protein